MLQSIGAGDVEQLLFRVVQERSARCRENDFVYGVVAFAGQTLEDGRVLRVDGYDGGAVFESELRDEVAGHDERLFVGQGYGFVSFNRLDGGTQSGIAHHCGYDYIDVGERHGIGNGIVAGVCFDRKVGQGIAQRGIMLFVGDDGNFGTVFASLLYKEVYVIVGRNEVNLELLRIFVDNFQRLPAYRAGRA